jgi:type II secretory pathway component PulC
MAQIKELKNFLEEMFAPIFLSERSRHLGMVAFILACLLITYAVGMTLFNWYHDFKTPKEAPVELSLATVNTEAQLIAQLPQLHLFGPEGDDAFLPLTNLQLRLTGILRDLKDERSKVIISEGDQPGKVYAIGDTLLNGITIKEISDDGIVLEHSGRLEKLPLTRDTPEFKDSPKTMWQE